MRAVAYSSPGHIALTEVDDPTPSPEQVVLRVEAAGLCHTDLHLRSGRDPRITPGRVLGHEICGTVIAVGLAVSSDLVGNRAVVHPSWGCGRCRSCLAGRPQACCRTGGRLITPITPGISADGGMADLVAVPATALGDATDLDPAAAATMADAALTPYGAVSSVKHLLDAGSSVLVIGLGGLGAMALQILRATTPARIVVTDIDRATLTNHRDSADLAIAADNPLIVNQILAYTDGSGVDAVLDFVGADSTLSLALDTVAPFGMVSVTGMSGGSVTVQADATARVPRGVSVVPRAYGGSSSDLLAVLGLMRSGELSPAITEFSLAHAQAAFEALATGSVRGRIVLRPDL